MVQLDILDDQQKQLKILSYGAGQDSSVLIHKMINELDAIVFSDTGNEHPHTYETVERAQKFAESHGVKFIRLNTADEYHNPSWPSLTGQWDRNSSVQLARSKACTDGLKITPIYKWLNDFCGELLGVDKSDRQDRGKPHIVEYAKQHGKIQMMIGIAKGEEKRVGKDFPNKWANDSIERVYPLIENEMGRNECQVYLKSVEETLGTVWPSNCMFCHFQSKQELLWLHRNHPEDFSRWVEYEAAKIEKYAHKEKNHGVYGKKLLLEKLADAIAEFGDWSDERLDEYKFSHGHCVTNAY